MSLTDKLYDTAKACLGQDLSPVQDTLGCAETVNTLRVKAYGDRPTSGASTALLEKELEQSDKWQEVYAPQKGAIIISATGTQAIGSRVKHGHVGVVGQFPSEDGTVYVMSNNSQTSLLDTQFTIKKWNDYFGIYGKFPVRYFIRIK